MDATSFPTASAPAKTSTLPPQQLAQIRKSAEDFQAMFMSEMMGHMFEGMQTDPMFGGGHGEEMFRGMMIREYGKNVAKSAQGAALTDQLQQAMIRMQENLNNQNQKL
jgi:flagellar protein FlgJ